MHLHALPHTAFSLCPARPGRAAALILCALLCLAPGCAREKPVVWTLSPEARDTCTVLLLDDAMRTDDAAGVLEAAEAMLAGVPRPQLLIEAGGWLLLNKQPALARRLLDKATAALPRDLPLHLLLAECWVDEGRADQAVAVLEAFCQRRPDSGQARQELGILLRKVRRWQAAADIFRALPAPLRTPYVRLCHAQCLLELGRPDAAVRQLSIALEQQPASDDIREALAIALMQAGNPVKSRILYRHLLAKNPANTALRLRVIGLELDAGRPAAALELAADDAGTHGFALSAASLFLEKKRYAEAETLLRKLARRPNPPDDLWLFRAAATYEARQDLPAALDWLKKIPETSAFADRAALMHGQLLISAGQWRQAADVLADGQTRFPKNREIALLRIQTLLAQKNFDAAQALADQAVLRRPADTELLFCQGSVRDARADKAGALAIMEHILTLEPDHFRALNYVGFTLADRAGEAPAAPARAAARKADLERALTLLRQAVRLAPDRAYILDSLAWAQFRAGQTREAWNSIRATVKMPGGADEAEIWEHYGDIAHSLGHAAEARRGWKRALALNSEHADSLRQKLAALSGKPARPAAPATPRPEAGP